MFVLENFIMILLFYFSEKFNMWYLLLVIVCVCLLGVIGVVIWIIFFKFFFLFRDSDSDRYSDIENDSNYNEILEVNNNDNLLDDVWYVVIIVWL